MKHALLLSCGLISHTAYCQVDSTDRFILGLQAHWGISQQDFSPLHKYGFLLDQPPRTMFNPGIPGVSFFFGNPNKLFVSLDTDPKMGVPTKGTFNGQEILVNTSNGSFGSSVIFPLRSFPNGRLRRVYASTGVQRKLASISSKITDPPPPTNADALYYESSRAGSTAVRMELIFEFVRKGRPVNWEKPRLMAKAGYDLQLGTPKWSGSFTRVPNDGSSSVNLGGFFFGVGVNYWGRKGLPKAPLPVLVEDPTKRFSWGSQFFWGATHLDISSLNRYGYELNGKHQILITPVIPGISLFFGDRDKLFASVDMGAKMGLPINGTYDNYNIRLSTTRGTLGGSGFFLLRSDPKSSVRKLWGTLGLQWSITGVSSAVRYSAVETGSVTARSTALCGGMMLEFPRKGTRKDRELGAFMLRAGYAVPLGRSEWSGAFTKNPNERLGPAHLGGLTLGLGVNVWHRRTRKIPAAQDGQGPQ
jgi:hypothetical protein